MPYSSVGELPAWVRKRLSAKKQRQYMHVWNSVFTKTGNETRAFKAANAVASAMKRRLNRT